MTPESPKDKKDTEFIAPKTGDLPHGPVQGKDTQNPDGQSIETPSNRETTPLDTAMLKNISERCLATYPDKYVSGLFEVNVDLSDSEIREIEKLLELAKARFEALKANYPLYSKLEALLEERRKKVGPFHEEASIIEDPTATDVTKVLKDGTIPAINTSPTIKHLYLWENTIRQTEETVANLKAKRARGKSAKPLGRGIRELYRFIKETTP